jgi:hypothetical protein
LEGRYDGTKWSVISSPNPSGSTGSDLFGVTALSATDILAVGDYGTSTPPSKTLIEQYNGTKWSILPSPNSGLGTSYNIFSGVAAASATDIYAVGEAGASNGGGIGALSLNGTSNATSSPTGVTLIEHWNGTKWSVVSSPNPGTGNNSLYAVAHIPSTAQFWAVGAYNNGVPPVQSLAEFYNP